MLFHTWVFALFMLAVYPIYLLTRKNIPLMNAWLLLWSYVFYGWWNPAYLILIVASTVFDWYMGILIGKGKHKKLWITFSILLLLASIEAGLAYMREVLLQDELATSALLRGGEAAIENNFLWITTAAQMGMGFILPFALTFVAIPFETFVHSSRTVLGLCGIGFLRALAMLLRVLSNGFRHFGTLLERLYDLPLFVPLWLEARAKAAAESDRSREVVPTPEAQV